jgi:hypothetical protein
VLATGEAKTDAAQKHAESHARVSEDVQVLLGAEQDRHQHARRADDQNVEGNRDVGGNRSDGGDEHAGGIIKRKARGIVRSRGPS